MDRAMILNDYVRQLVAAGNPEAIVLFGSEAGDRANDDSDFDFLIIERNADHRRPRGIQYQMALRPRIIAADILVRTPEELQQAMDEGNPLIKEILQTGRWVCVWQIAADFPASVMWDIITTDRNVIWRLFGRHQY
jgi:predicted nucleotidyltransferase